MGTQKRYRIGIDVGGTFTHAVAIEAETQKLAGKTKVPTTHSSKFGVGEGVIQSLRALMDQAAIRSDQIALVAHSTTQATNSLLEGDVDPVGIISIGSGLPGFLAARTARGLSQISLGSGKYLKTQAYHLDPKKPETLEGLNAWCDSIRQQGIRVLVIAAPFSVDWPDAERAVAQHLKSMGFFVTPTHEVSQLYGLKIRMRTTAINASILPKMLEVANHTESRIREAGITAPFLIMRSDGGVMSIEEMRRKPVLTLLSGPAAGIAAALRYLKITDGVFLEVGGTSTDISVIRNGRAITRTAVIGGNPTFLKTLDCRTLGIGGGSVPRGSPESVRAVGPRSAHIAGVRYAAFGSEGFVASGFEIKTFQPRAGDPSDYWSIGRDGQTPFALTPTCAANALGLVPNGDPAQAARGWPEAWSGFFKESGQIEKISTQILERATDSVAETVERLLKEYRLEPGWTTLIGGGGGASAIVPYLAKRMGMKFEIARDSDVISAIGVALGLVRETVERSIVNPTPEDIARVRQDARERVIAQGASADSVEVLVEVDSQKNLVRAEAQGSIEFKRDLSAEAATQASPQTTGASSSDPALSAQARSAFGLKAEPSLMDRADSSGLSAYAFELTGKAWAGLRTRKRRYSLVTDRKGVVRLRLAGGTLLQTQVGQIAEKLSSEIERHTQYGDGGAEYPAIHACLGDRIVDLSKLQSPDQFASVLAMEAKEYPSEASAVLIFSERSLEDGS